MAVPCSLPQLASRANSERASSRAQRLLRISSAHNDRQLTDGGDGWRDGAGGSGHHLLLPGAGTRRGGQRVPGRLPAERLGLGDSRAAPHLVARRRQPFRCLQPPPAGEAQRVGSLDRRAAGAVLAPARHCRLDAQRPREEPTVPRRVGSCRLAVCGGHGWAGGAVRFGRLHGAAAGHQDRATRRAAASLPAASRAAACAALARALAAAGRATPSTLHALHPAHPPPFAPYTLHPTHPIPTAHSHHSPLPCTLHPPPSHACSRRCSPYCT